MNYLSGSQRSRWGAGRALTGGVLSILDINHRQLYRLPWSATDNVISWLEPTKQCNISCDGCYSANVKGSHKSLDQIRADLDVFERFRTTDAVSIAGGDPLTHPQLAEVVGLIAERGLKPIVNTNGVALTPALLRELAAAGLAGITFHVDSLQKRPGWVGRTEVELNELRQRLADLVAEVGGISCAFNATVYEKTLPLVPDIVAWAQRNPSKVQVVVFIAFRTEDTRFDYYAGRDKIETRKLVYHGGRPERIDISSREIADVIQARFPVYRPAAYLNGTERPDRPQVAPVARRQRRRGAARQRGPEVRGTLAGGVPPSERAVPELRRTEGDGAREDDAAAGGHGPRPTSSRASLGGQAAAPPLACAPAAAPPVHHDHPAHRHDRRRARLDVRRLPRHDRPPGRARVVVPAGGAAPVPDHAEGGAAATRHERDSRRVTSAAFSRRHLSNAASRVGRNMPRLVTIALISLALAACGQYENACTRAGGTILRQGCCASASNFPNTCALGACGCSPQNSAPRDVCQCPAGQCFNGTTCQAR